MFLSSVGKIQALLVLLKGRPPEGSGQVVRLGQKPNPARSGQVVSFVRLSKIELKKMCGGENKKYRSKGNECRLTRCPFEIWFE